MIEDRSSFSFYILYIYLFTVCFLIYHVPGMRKRALFSSPPYLKHLIQCGHILLAESRQTIPIRWKNKCKFIFLKVNFLKFLQPSLSHKNKKYAWLRGCRIAIPTTFYPRKYAEAIIKDTMFVHLLVFSLDSQLLKNRDCANHSLNSYGMNERKHDLGSEI